MPTVAKTFRLEESTVEALKKRAPSRQSTPNQTEIVESAVREKLGLKPVRRKGSAPAASKAGSRTAGPEPVGTPEQAPPAEAPAVNLAVWLAGRTGMPKAVLERAVRDGKVKVGGDVCELEKIPARELKKGVSAFGQVYYP